MSDKDDLSKINDALNDLTENKKENPVEEEMISKLGSTNEESTNSETTNEEVINKKKLDLSFLKDKKIPKLGKLSKKTYIIIAAAVGVVIAVYIGISLQNYMSQSTVKSVKNLSNTAKSKPSAIKKVASSANVTNATNSTNSTNSTNVARNIISRHNIMKTANNIVPISSKQAFDIFSLEPSQEYKLDNMKSIYQKSLEILKLQEDILKTKSKIKDIEQPVVKNKSSSNEPSNVPPLPSKQLSGKTTPFPTNLPKMPTVPFPTKLPDGMPSNLPTGMPTNNGMGTSMSASNGSSVLSKVSVNLIYHYQGKEITVVQYGNSIFRAGVGDHVAPGYTITSIKSDGVYVTGPDGEAFLPLAFRSSSKDMYFTKNSHSQKGNTNTSLFGSSFTPPSFQPPQNNSIPVSGPNIGGLR